MEGNTCINSKIDAHYHSNTQRYIITELQSLYKAASAILLPDKSYYALRKKINLKQNPNTINANASLIYSLNKLDSTHVPKFSQEVEGFSRCPVLLLKSDCWELNHFISKLEIYTEVTGRQLPEESKRAIRQLRSLVVSDNNRENFVEYDIKVAFLTFLESFELESEESEIEIEEETKKLIDNEDPPTIELQTSSTSITPNEESCLSVEKVTHETYPSSPSSQVSISSSLSSKSPKKLTPTRKSFTDFVSPKVAVQDSVDGINRSLFESHKIEMCNSVAIDPKLLEQLQLTSKELHPLWESFYKFIKNVNDGKYSLKVVSMNLLKFTEEKARKILCSDVRNIFLGILRHFDVVAIQEVEGGQGETHDGLGEICEALGTYEYYCHSIGTQREAFIVNTEAIDVTDVYDWSGTKMQHKPFEIKLKCLKNDKIYRMVNVHLKPSQKISELFTVLSGIRRELDDESNYVLLGDINYQFGGGCQEMDKELEKEPSAWKWMNSKEEPTTPTQNVYDAILCLERSVPQQFTSGVYKFPSLGLYDNLLKSPLFSDHYPVYWLVR